MSWVKETFSSSLGKKLVMAITGLFLVQFLLVHLIGNFPLLLDDNGEAFNAYAHFMKHNKIIVISEVVLFLGFIFHIVQGIQLVFANKAARSQGYSVSHKNSKVNPMSKYMGPFGMVILVFLIYFPTQKIFSNFKSEKFSKLLNMLALFYGVIILIKNI